MTKMFSLTVVVAMALYSCNGQNDLKPASLKTDLDSASYALGVAFGGDINGYLESGALDSNLNMTLILSGIRQVLEKAEKPTMTEEEAVAIIQGFQQRITEKKANANKELGDKFLADNASKPNVITTESGLQYIVLKEGTGNSPTIMDQVKVHYTGKLTNGKVFDSSEERGEPVTFYLRQVIPGWTEALQLMKPGAEYKIFIPGNLAYGPQGGPQGSGIGPNEVLLFDVRLIDVLPPAK